MPRFVENAPEAVLAAAKEMLAKGLVEGTAGNISARKGDLVAVTPTGADLSTVTAEMVTVIDLEGEGTDAAMMKSYLAAWGDREAYAVSHVGFGMNPGARYEALSMYDQRDTNGTELRAVSGNFLFSTGANEFAGRYTSGHFDLPMMGTTIELDGVAVVREGVLQDVFG